MSIDSTNSLQSRLAALKESTNSIQQESIEECKVETPLWVFLYIYLKARKSMLKAGYVNYGEGAKALINFLKPIKFPSNLEFDYINLPDFYRGAFEVKELIKHLINSYGDYLQSNLNEREYVEYAIFYSLTYQMKRFIVVDLESNI